MGQGGCDPGRHRGASGGQRARAARGTHGRGTAAADFVSNGAGPGRKARGWRRRSAQGLRRSTPTTRRRAVAPGRPFVTCYGSRTNRRRASIGRLGSKVTRDRMVGSGRGPKSRRSAPRGCAPPPPPSGPGPAPPLPPTFLRPAKMSRSSTPQRIYRRGHRLPSSARSRTAQAAAATPPPPQ